MKPNRDLGADPQDQVASDTRFGLGQDAGTWVLRFAAMSPMPPAPREVPVQIDPAGVWSGVRCDAVGVEVADDPEQGLSRRAAGFEVSCNRDPSALVAVDRPNHQEPARSVRVAKCEPDDGPPLHGAPEDLSSPYESIASTTTLGGRMPPGRWHSPKQRPDSSCHGDQDGKGELSLEPSPGAHDGSASFGLLTRPPLFAEDRGQPGYAAATAGRIVPPVQVIVSSVDGTGIGLQDHDETEMRDQIGKPLRCPIPRPSAALEGGLITGSSRPDEVRVTERRGPHEELDM